MSEVFKALREQVRHVSSLRCGYGTTDAIQSHDELVDMAEQQLTAANERAEKLQARIDESQKQEPVGYVTDHDWSSADLYQDMQPDTKLYAQPIIPPDVEELYERLATQTRKLGEERVRCAELRKKLEEVPSYSCGCIRRVDW